MLLLPLMKLSKEIKIQILSDIKEKYLIGLSSLKDLAVQYNVSENTMSKYIGKVLSEMSSEIRIDNEQATKRLNSEEEVAKYGIPEKYKLKNNSLVY